MDSAIGKAIDLACQYTVEPIAHQFKYVFCYKSCVAEMNESLTKLKNEKEIVDHQKTEAQLNMRLIHTKASDWLEAVTQTQEEVSSLMMYEDGKAKSSCCGRIGAGQIVDPCARHKLGRKAIKKKQTIEELRRERPRPDEISYAPPPPGIVDHEATADGDAAKQQNDGIFRSSRWKEIMEEIMKDLKDERMNVVGLYGMGGVGKSTMIREVYDQVKKHGMFDEVASVEVKVKPEIRRIQEEVAFALGLKFENESPTIRAAQLSQRLLRKNSSKDENNDTGQKKKKTVLIILDDLWEKLNLQEVGIPSGGSDQVYIKLFLTSRREDVLSDKMGAYKPIHLDVLNVEDALRMFKFFVGLGAENVGADKVTEIVTKCSGLPIVIEATAKALKNKALDEWEKILKRLDNSDVIEKLKVSYDYLPSKESKELFLICGIFRGPRIQVRDLLKYTFGLRLFNRKDSSTLVAATAKLEKLLSVLEAASMLLKSDDRRYVKIHDRMRELAARIVEKDHPEWAYDVNISDNSCELLHASELKLLHTYYEGNAYEEGLQASFLKDKEKLNVLEFTNMIVELSFPSRTTQLDQLRNLITLCLHNCCLVDISMIGGLKGLEILSFRGSDLRTLPSEFRELNLLKMLDLSDCKKLTHIEVNVLAGLISLEELNMENSFKDWENDQVEDEPPKNARLVELRNMSRLSNVRIHIPKTSMLPKDGQLFSSKLSMYQIKFGVAWTDDLWGKSVEDDDIYSQFSDEYNKFSRVVMLTFDSPDTIWQDWVQMTLQRAEALYLSGHLDEKCESIGNMCIKGFECLKHLRMRNCPSFRFIISSNDTCSTNLESLFLEKLEKLEKLCGGLPYRQKEAFRKLRVIKVYECIKLTHLFDFSLLKSHLSSQLEEIVVNKCDEVQYIIVGEGDNNCDVVTLSNLHKLVFKSVPKFLSFWAGASSNVIFSGKTVAFPCLESLEIAGLDELEHIWHPTYPPDVLGNLRFLVVQRCSKLVRVINSNVLMRLQGGLELLRIYACGSMKQVFDVDDGIITSYCADDDEHLVLFSRLKNLELYMNVSLECIYNLSGSRDNRSLPKMTTMFPKIESIFVWWCDGLKYLLLLPPRAGAGFVYLREITVLNCDQMEAIVMMSGRMVDQEDDAQKNYDNSLSFSYSSLKEMSINSCPKLRTFCQYMPSSKHDTAANHDLPFFSKKEIFPCLESLHLEGLSKLDEIWPHEVPPETSFKMLNKVTIEKCAGLSAVFPLTLIPRLENLTDLEVLSCDEMTQIVHGGYSGGGSSNSRVDEGESIKMVFTFPFLRKLSLGDLPHFDRFYSSASSACGFEFPSLEILHIWDCRGVKMLFSNDDSGTSMVGALFKSCDSQLAIPNLKLIDLDGLENLTKIWKGEKSRRLFMKLESLSLTRCSCTNLESLISVGVAASLSCWNVLKMLHVEGCDGLEYLLSPVGATSLVHLTSLYIGCCKNIKEVVVAVDASNEENHTPDMITFHHLTKLVLEDLPRLEKFSSVANMALNFPSLVTLDIKKCPNMTTFSSGIAIASSTHNFGDLNSFVQKI